MKKIATILNCHKNDELLKDTLDSIRNFLSKDVLLVIDGYSKDDFSDINYTYKIEGFTHNSSKAPYRNVILGLMNAWKIWGEEADWYCYTEPDCLFAENDILKDLEKRNSWLVGNNLQKEKLSKNFEDNVFPFVEKIIKKQINDTYYLIGCCLFFKKDFIRKLIELDFFEKILIYTNAFNKGEYPKYKGHDISEHLFPTLAWYLGGGLGEFANSTNPERLSGEYNKYKIRFGGSYTYHSTTNSLEKCSLGDLGIEDFESCKKSYVMHPIKEYNNPIRKHHRMLRQKTSQILIDSQSSMITS